MLPTWAHRRSVHSVVVIYTLCMGISTTTKGTRHTLQRCYGLGLSNPSPACLSSGSTLVLTFISIGFGCLTRAKHLPENLSRTPCGFSLFYTDSIPVTLSRIQFKIAQRWNYTHVLIYIKKIRLMNYKYIMNLLSQMFTISSFFTAHIFLEHLSLEYYCIFSL